eukprot:TCONS_00073822-protein
MESNQLKEMLSMEKVDYSQWERKKVQEKKVNLKKSNSSLASPPRPKTISRAGSSRLPTATPTNNEFQNGGEVTADPFRDLRKECSTLCRHGPRKVKSPEFIRKENKTVKEGVISLLKVQIKDNRKSLHESKQRYLQLMKDNFRLKEEITSFERETHHDVTDMLECHRKYRTGISVLTSQHSNTIIGHQEELELKERRVKFASNILHSDVEDLDRSIEEEKTSLKILLNYKEKEYPEQLEQIKYLKEEIEILSKQHEKVMEELSDVANREQIIYQSKAYNVLDNVKSKFADEALDQLDPSMKSLALQNRTMRQEIEQHQEQERLEKKEITELKKHIAQLKTREARRLKLLSHPTECFEKCNPESDMELSIPLQKV